MSGTTVNDVARSAIMAAWGLATLVLIFSVGLLGYELYSRGERQAEAVPLEIGLGTTPVSGLASPGTTSAVQLYFGSPYSSGLRAETRLVPLGRDTVENCKAVFTALAAGPGDDGVPTLGKSVHVRAMYLLSSGDLVVDFSRDVDVPELHSATAELLMVRSLTLTLTQPSLRTGDSPPIKRVQFLFEGAPTGSHFPEHIKLDAPMEPQSSWVIPPRSRDGNV